MAQPKPTSIAFVPLWTMQNKMALPFPFLTNVDLFSLFFGLRIFLMNTLASVLFDPKRCDLLCRKWQRRLNPGRALEASKAHMSRGHPVALPLTVSNTCFPLEPQTRYPMTMGTKRLAVLRLTRLRNSTTNAEPKKRSH